MASKIEKDITRLVMTSAPPGLIGSYGTQLCALKVDALKRAIIKASIEYDIACALRLGKKMKRAKNVLIILRMRLRKKLGRLLRKSDLNPNAPAWIPQRLRRPRMRRYHAVNAPDEIQGVLCAQR